MANLPNEVYIHVQFDAERFKEDLRKAIADVLGNLERYVIVGSAPTSSPLAHRGWCKSSHLESTYRRSHYHEKADTCVEWVACQ